MFEDQIRRCVYKKERRQSQAARIKFMTPRETVMRMVKSKGVVQGAVCARGKDSMPQESWATNCEKSVKDAVYTFSKPFEHPSHDP